MTDRVPFDPRGRRPDDRQQEAPVFRAIADVLRSIGSTIASVVTLPFRALARLFGGASRGHA